MHCIKYLLANLLTYKIDGKVAVEKFKTQTAGKSTKTSTKNLLYRKEDRPRRVHYSLPAMRTSFSNKTLLTFALWRKMHWRKISFCSS